MAKDKKKFGGSPSDSQKEKKEMSASKPKKRVGGTTSFKKGGSK